MEHLHASLSAKSFLMISNPTKVKVLHEKENKAAESPNCEIRNDTSSYQ